MIRGGEVVVCGEGLLLAIKLTRAGEFDGVGWVNRRVSSSLERIFPSLSGGTEIRGLGVDVDCAVDSGAESGTAVLELLVELELESEDLSRAAFQGTVFELTGVGATIDVSRDPEVVAVAGVVTPPLALGDTTATGFGLRRFLVGSRPRSLPLVLPLLRGSRPTRPFILAA